MKVGSRCGYAFILFLILSLFSSVQARIYIWRIGNMDGSFREFSFIDERLIEYNVLSDWNLIAENSNPDSIGFPYALYTCCDTEKRPQEIMINFDYTRDYGNPRLTIISTLQSPDPNSRFSLAVFKGGNRLFIDLKRIEYRPYALYSFSLGYIRRGSHEENQIILRGIGTAGTPMIFDALYLSIDDKDSDGDGVPDEDEGDAYLNQAIVSIPIASYNPNPLYQQRITLRIDRLDRTDPYFCETGFLDTNLATIPPLSLTDRYVPYEPLSFKIKGLGSYDRIRLLFGVSDTFYPSVSFYTCQDVNQNKTIWRETDPEMLDGNLALITLYDGGKGDSDGEPNGTIATIMTFSYPKRLGVHIEGQGCFIGTLTRRGNYESYL